ncbi:MAG: GrpB family protein [Puniceicoccales bacterium]|jgi:hypothetical protein|nr:GrpB family protein [Puniceicoccales bacterium]
MTAKEHDRISRSWFDQVPPDGHAPMGGSTMPGFMFIYEPGTPEMDAAMAEYDRDYFRAHPEDREKYGYTGP